jgi:hypothetical protein
MSSRNILLNAVGKQDEYININPETTYFKDDYHTHTNFSKVENIICSNCSQSDHIEYNFNDLVIFDIEKPGDLLLNVKVEVILEGNHWEDINNVVPQTMYALIEYVELVSDNKILQKLSGHWMYIWNQIYDPTNKNNIPIHAYASQNNKICNNPIQYKLMLNIPFWFSQNPGLALPLWATQNERLFIRLKLRKFNEITYEADINKFKIKNIRLITEIIELDVDEKQKFQNTSLEYIIEQVEFNNTIDIVRNNKNKLKINLDQYPFVNEIIWVFTGKCFQNCVYLPNDYFNFWPCFNGQPESLNYTDHTSHSGILLNGKYLNPKLKASYYRKIQRYQYLSTSPDMDKNIDPITEYGKYNCIYSYSFSLKPTQVKSSGFLSTEKFNSINLNLELIPMNYNRNLFIFQKRLNIIRIKDGYINFLNS